MAPSSPFRSTVFRLTLLAVAALGFAAAAIVVLIGLDANRALTRATEDLIRADVESLRADYAAGGIEALAAAVADKARHTTGGVYYLGDGAGARRAGNLPAPPGQILGAPSAGIFPYRTAATTSSRNPIAAGRRIDLEAGHVLVIGRDIEGQRALLAGLNRNLMLGLGGLALLGIGGGYLLARHILDRIGAMSAASRTIMAGELTQRLPLAGTGDELDALAAQLNAMLERIERLMTGMREVSDNIAHDLKTPLNRLRNAAEAALADPQGSDAWRHGLEHTIEQADELIKTFNALLLIARLEAGAVDESLEVADLARIARDVAELYEPVAEEQGIRLAIETTDRAPILANRQLIGQAIANLIDNAIKYGRAETTEQAGRLQLRIAVTTRDGRAIVAVADNGPGIDAADRARALERFVRLDASRSRPGTGLGLSLVAAVAQLHRGEIRLEDNAPGLRVVLALPLHAGANSPAVSPIEVAAEPPAGGAGAHAERLTGTASHGTP